MAAPVRTIAVEALFGPHRVRAFSAGVDPMFTAQLHRDEAVGTETMSPGRHAEFATARACAHAALGELDETGPILRLPDGAPQWPAGIVGSITHSRGYCIGVCAAAGALRAVGIDAESIERMKPTTARRVLTAIERAEMERLDPDAAERHLTTVFAAKEAFYKAQYHLTRTYLGFDAVVVQHRDDGVLGFAPASGAADSELVHAARGSHLVADGRVVVGVCITAPAP